MRNSLFSLFCLLLLMVASIPGQSVHFKVVQWLLPLLSMNRSSQADISEPEKEALDQEAARASSGSDFSPGEKEFDALDQVEQLPEKEFDVLEQVQQEAKRYLLGQYERLRPMLLEIGWTIKLSEIQIPHARLEYAQLEGISMNHANLTSANLQRANLQGAKLEGALFTKANLRHADFSRARLVGADLSDAELKRAELKGANLQGANLSGADLRLANFYGANLKEANLTGANLKVMLFDANTQLDKAYALESGQKVDVDKSFLKNKGAHYNYATLKDLEAAK